MQCQNCSYDNPSGAKFCQNCGYPMIQVCPRCETENAANARFCMNCGFGFPTSPAVDEQKSWSSTSSEISHSLTPQGTLLDQPSLPVDLERTSGKITIPGMLAENHLTSPKIIGERRVITTLFADVVDSTALAARFDPEDWTGIMNRAFTLLTPAIYRYEGTVARLMGDALLAFFGAPRAHEDDPHRAVQAGIDLLAITREYAGEMRRKYGIDFSLRVGINTGQAVVGAVGSSQVYEYTAMGDAVNLAARLQSSARPMTVLISESTYRLVSPVFESVDLGEIKVKGVTRPVHVFEVTRMKAGFVHHRGMTGLQSPMVGRQTELAILIHLTETLRTSMGRMCLVVGEPGIGKSRLTTEWKAALDEAQLPGADTPTRFRWAEGHALSYGQNRPYHLVVDLVRSLFEIPPGIAQKDAQAILESSVERLFGDAAITIYPYLGHLLMLPQEGPALERVRMLDPQALHAQYLAALRQLLSALASNQLLILILDDLHWADPSSVELITKLLPSLAQLPVLTCLVTRPDHLAPGWSLVTAVRERLGDALTELKLTALSEADSRQLVSNLLEIETLSESTRNLILHKSEGNPFFVEEVIRMLIDRGLLVQKDQGWSASQEITSMDIPDNIQSLLLARIDRLSDEARHVIRVAAVIGRQFSVKILAKVLEGE
jgi:class 3 adenylate cyclase